MGGHPLTLLLDADILLFEASVAVEVTTQWEDDVWTIMSDPKDAIAILRHRIAEFEEDTGIAEQDMVFCLSDTVNFRFDVADFYKSNRKGTRKPLCYPSVKQFLIDNYTTKMFPKIEGDDVIGLLSDGDVGIWSADKDLKQIPGLHWDGDDWEEVTEEEADRFFFYQCLAGDAADGYKGCPGVGPVKADRILAKDPSWEAVVKAYEKQELTEADALITARLARILRPGEYDFIKKEPILWQP